MTNKQTLGIVVVAMASLVLLAYLLGSYTNIALSSATPGLPAYIATTSSLGVGPQEEKVWWGAAGSTTPANCAARIISTTGGAITFVFGNGSSTAQTSLTSQVGHIQGASTTAVYDSGLYGCGYVAIHGSGGSTTITITETQ